MKKHLGQSLIEVLIAMGLLVLNVSVITFLVLDVYLTDRIGREKMIATFLAQEGIEATKSVRDNNWNNLINGEYGLVLTGNQWIFQEVEEDISDYLHKGTRKIIVEGIDSDRKKITSEINWELTIARPQNVSLVTYFTNWQDGVLVLDCGNACQEVGYTGGSCQKPSACVDENELGILGEYGCPPSKICCCE